MPKQIDKWLSAILVGALTINIGNIALAKDKAEIGLEKRITVSAQNEMPKENAGDGEKRIPATNTPVKSVTKAPVRLVNPQLQRGEEIARLSADVDGDGIEETVLLMGNKLSGSTHYRTDLYVVAKNPKTDQIKGFVRPSNLGGYDAYLTTCDVSGNGCKNIIVAAPTGGSGGIVNYRVLDFTTNPAREIFGSYENRGVVVTGNFEPDFKVKLVLPALRKSITLDLPADASTYVRLNAYNTDGSLKESGLRPTVQDLQGMIAVDTNGDGRDELITTQRVVGVMNSDALGYVRTRWEYKAGVWQHSRVDFQTTLESRRDFLSNEAFIGPSGYTISKENVVVEGSNVLYPHFGKLPPHQQGLINKQLEGYAKNILQSVVGKGQAQVKYDDKFLGRNFVSLFFYGSAVKNHTPEIIAEAFNFDLATGQDVPLAKLVSDQSAFWRIVLVKSKKENLVVNKKNVYSYYFDGDSLVLLYNDGREFELRPEDLGELLNKGLLQNEKSTKQSKRANESKIKKTEDK